MATLDPADVRVKHDWDGRFFSTKPRVSRTFFCLWQLDKSGMTSS